jgi:hypothetical protein
MHAHVKGERKAVCKYMGNWARGGGGSDGTCCRMQKKRVKQVEV